MPRFALAFLLAAGCLLAAAGKQIKISQPVFRQFDGGPPLPANQPFYPGETAFVTFLMPGFSTTEKGALSLTWHLEVRDPAGLLLAEPEHGTVIETVVAEDKEWSPKPQVTFLIPAEAGSGTYKVIISAKDTMNRTTATQEGTFLVEGKAVEPSPTLTIRNFRFLRGEDEAKPLPVAAYRANDAVWARFEIVGYKLGEKNRVQVEYGLSVLRPSGTSMYSEPKAAAADEATFYPKRFVGGVLSLKLDSTIKPGEYTIVLEVRDVLGGQKEESRHTFRVE